MCNPLNFSQQGGEARLREVTVVGERLGDVPVLQGEQHLEGDSADMRVRTLMGGLSSCAAFAAALGLLIALALLPGGSAAGQTSSGDLPERDPFDVGDVPDERPHGRGRMPLLSPGDGAAPLARRRVCVPGRPAATSDLRDGRIRLHHAQRDAQIGGRVGWSAWRRAAPSPEGA